MTRSGPPANHRASVMPAAPAPMMHRSQSSCVPALSCRASWNMADTGAARPRATAALGQVQCGVLAGMAERGAGGSWDGGRVTVIVLSRNRRDLLMACLAAVARLRPTRASRPSSSTTPPATARPRPWPALSPRCTSCRSRPSGKSPAAAIWVSPGASAGSIRLTSCSSTTIRWSIPRPSPSSWPPPTPIRKSVSWRPRPTAAPASARWCRPAACASIPGWVPLGRGRRRGGFGPA